MMDIKALLNEMTLDEKLFEMSQLYGEIDGVNDDRIFMGVSWGFDVSEEMQENIGSLLGISGAAVLKKAQTEHIKKSRLKIPMLFMHDIIHGYKTIFPSPLAMSTSWQPELVEKSAVIAAKEAAISGLHLTFSPMADLSRDARWGRVVESCGEDPYLNALYASAFVKGYQGNDVADKYKIAACVKHFAAYGMAEAGRDYNTTDISEFTLREFHFPAYKAALDAGVKMVMTSFNALNGVPATGNKWLYRNVLRDEMNFDGVVISDCTAVTEMINHGYCEDGKEACLKSIVAGCDIEMVSNTYATYGKQLVDENKLSIELIDEAVLRILKLKQELGLFENPYKDADEDLEKTVILCDEHRETAIDIAKNSMVLLKNDNNTLPLNNTKGKIALIGPYADSRSFLDLWSAYGEEKDCKTIREVLADDYDILCNTELKVTEQTMDIKAAFDAPAKFGNYGDDEFEKELELAKQGDVVIIAMGEGSAMSGEAASRTSISIPGNQEKLFNKVCELGKPVIVILFNGRPLALENVYAKADAILEAWLPGTEGANAIKQILTGEFSPVGRLTMSFPRVVGQCPIYYNAYSTGRPVIDENDKEKFKSRYLDCDNSPLFPFGYGLTYSKFEYTNLSISKNQMTLDEKLKVSVTVKNVGEVTATEVVQFYINDVSGSLVRPVKMLKGFERVTLNKGEEKTVEFTIDESMLKFHTLENGFNSESGKFKVFACSDALETNYVEFELVK